MKYFCAFALQPVLPTPDRCWGRVLVWNEHAGHANIEVAICIIFMRKTCSLCPSTYLSLHVSSSCFHTTVEHHTPFAYALLLGKTPHEAPSLASRLCCHPVLRICHWSSCSHTPHHSKCMYLMKSWKVTDGYLLVHRRVKDPHMARSLHPAGAGRG
jgi:hypothetical protein